MLLSRGPCQSRLTLEGLLCRPASIPCREACLSILTAVQRMHSPDTVATCPPEAAELQRAALLPRDAALLQLLVAGVVGALPSGRFMDLADTLVDILVVSSLSV